MKPNCAFQKCGRPIFASGLCSGHYQQQRRGDELRPLRAGPGESTQMTLRLPKTMRREAANDAAIMGIDESEWWRQAGSAYLIQRARMKGKNFKIAPITGGAR